MKTSTKLKITENLIFCLLLFGCSSIDTSEVKSLAEELYFQPQITEMDDGTRSRKYINGIPITMKPKANYPIMETSTKQERYYIDVLEEENIDIEKYTYFQKRLEETGLRHYYRKDDLSIFIQGGALGDKYGVLVIHNNAEIPKNGFRLSEIYYINLLAEIEKNIFYIN